MKVSPKTSRSENVSDTSVLQSFSISQLFPSNIVTTEHGGAGIHSPYATLVALLKGQARLMPDDLAVSEGQIILIPSTYPCHVLPEGRAQIELAATDFCFKSHGMDISTALPEHPIVIVDNPAELLTRDICIISNATAGSSNITRTTEQLASGFRIANTLSIVLGWNTNPKLSPPEDEELQTLTAFLESNYPLPLTIDDIADACNLSRRKAFKVASRHEARTPIRILKQIRLERSLELLRRDGFSVGRIASVVGFGDARNFSREFKKSYGLTPVQYKQQSQLNIHTESLVNKAETNMQMNVNRRASILYLQAIDSAPPNTDLNELHYKAGLALHRAGDDHQAETAWAKVTALYYRLLINMEECEGLNKSIDFERVIEKLKRVYDYGNRALRQRVANQLSKWMLECAAAEKHHAATHYSLLAKDLSKEHHGLRPNLARTLFATGQFKDVERYCPKEDRYIAAALRAMGQLQEHLERFPEMREQCARTHLRLGNVDVILKDYNDQPTVCVKILIDTGRAEEALSRYPQHNAHALLALGRYEELLHHHPDNLEMCVFSLANVGRDSEALSKASCSADLTSRLLLYLERPHEITSSPSRGFTTQNVRAATVLQGIHALEKGNLRYGLDILDSASSITDPDYRVGQEYYEFDLMIPFIRHMLPDISKAMPSSRWTSWTDHYREIVKNWRDCYVQQLWYDARFILGEIDEPEFRSQPYRFYSDSRLCLLNGIKCELNDSQDEAVAHYRRYLETLPPLTAHYNEGSPVPILKAFIRWRLNLLAE